MEMSPCAGVECGKDTGYAGMFEHPGCFSLKRIASVLYKHSVSQGGHKPVSTAATEGRAVESSVM